MAVFTWPEESFAVVPALHRKSKPQPSLELGVGDGHADGQRLAQCFRTCHARVQGSCGPRWHHRRIPADAIGRCRVFTPADDDIVHQEGYATHSDVVGRIGADCDRTRKRRRSRRRGDRRRGQRRVGRERRSARRRRIPPKRCRRRRPPSPCKHSSFSAARPVSL